MFRMVWKKESREVFCENKSCENKLKFNNTCQWSQWKKCSSTETEMTRRGSRELSVAVENFCFRSSRRVFWIFGFNFKRTPPIFKKIRNTSIRALEHFWDNHHDQKGQENNLSGGTFSKKFCSPNAPSPYLIMKFSHHTEWTFPYRINF